MAMNPEREKKRRKRLYKSFVLIMMLSLYAGLWLGADWVRYEGDFSGLYDGILHDLIGMREQHWAFLGIEGNRLPGILAVTPMQWLWGLAGMAGGALLCLSEYTTYLLNKNTRPGEEHGSAQFNGDYGTLRQGYVMSPRILAKWREEKLEKVLIRKGKNSLMAWLLTLRLRNVDRSRSAPGGRRVSARTRFSGEEVAYCLLNSQLYSKNVALSMDTRLTQLNLNVIMFGGSGAGKSRFFVEPNLLQGNSSFVVTDPSGELLMMTGSFLRQAGYEIKCLNIERMDESMRYNPFAYVEEDADIPVMVDALISNIEGPKKGGSGDNKFWDETSRTLLIAICGYLFETQPPERRNFNNVIKLIDMMDVSDNRTQAEDDLDRLFNDLEQANPSSYAVSNYKVIKSAGNGKTAQNIVISTLAIFARFFKLDKIANLTYRDELHLEEIGRKKCALFIVTPQGDTTYNFLASELYAYIRADGDGLFRELAATGIPPQEPDGRLEDQPQAQQPNPVRHGGPGEDPARRVWWGQGRGIAGE